MSTTTDTAAAAAVAAAAVVDNNVAVVAAATAELAAPATVVGAPHKRMRPSSADDTAVNGGDVVAMADDKLTPAIARKRALFNADVRKRQRADEEETIVVQNLKKATNAIHVAINDGLLTTDVRVERYGTSTANAMRAENWVVKTFSHGEDLLPDVLRVTW